jgi:hypothetical protein
MDGCIIERADVFSSSPSPHKVRYVGSATAYNHFQAADAILSATMEGGDVRVDTGRTSKQSHAWTHAIKIALQLRVLPTDVLDHLDELRDILLRKPARDGHASHHVSNVGIVEWA